MKRTVIIAPKKKRTSRMNGTLVTRNGFITAIDPATIDAINDAAPINSPIANEPELLDMALNVLNTSGEPFPNAKKVTPVFYHGR
jgi:hypothetical protein